MSFAPEFRVAVPWEFSMPRPKIPQHIAMCLIKLLSMHLYRQLEEFEAERQRQAQQVNSQREQLEAQRKEKEDLVRERERASQVIAANEKDKQGLEANKQQLVQQISGRLFKQEKARAFSNIKNTCVSSINCRSADRIGEAGDSAAGVAAQSRASRDRARRPEARDREAPQRPGARSGVCAVSCRGFAAQ